MYEPEYLKDVDLTEAERQSFRLTDELMALPWEEQLKVFWMLSGMHSGCDTWDEDLAECLRVRLLR